MTEVEKSLSKLADENNAEHRAFVGTFRKTVEHGIRAGELLSTAKSQCSHGTWLAWVEENFEGAPRTAQEYMRLFNHRHELRANARTPAHLSMSGALKEIAAPKPTKTEAEAPPRDRREALEELERGLEADRAEIRRVCFDLAENFTEIHRGKGYRHRGYSDLASYLKAHFDGLSWLYYIVDDLVDERGEPYDVFTMAAILYEKGPEAMTESLLAKVPVEERQRLREEWAMENSLQHD